MGKKSSIVLFIILLIIMSYPIFFENIEKIYLSYVHSMPINKIYGGIFSTIYESKSDNALTWIIYTKRKNKKVDHTYLVYKIDKDDLNKMTSKYMRKYNYEDAEILSTALFLNKGINNLGVNDLNEESLKEHLFYRVRFRFGERDYKSLEYNIFADEHFIKDYK